MIIATSFKKFYKTFERFPHKKTRIHTLVVRNLDFELMFKYACNTLLIWFVLPINVSAVQIFKAFGSIKLKLPKFQPEHLGVSESSVDTNKNFLSISLEKWLIIFEPDCIELF